MVAGDRHPSLSMVEMTNKFVSERRGSRERGGAPARARVGCGRGRRRRRGSPAR